MTNNSKCSHEWHNDPMFEEGVVEMFFDGRKEMRQNCVLCGEVQYV